MAKNSTYRPLHPGTTHLPLGGHVCYQPGWLDPQAAPDLMQEVRRCAILDRETITMFGRSVPQPRETGWFLRRYAAATKYLVASAAPDPGPLLTSVLATLGSQLGWRPNAVLVNAYSDRGSSVSWHADDESSLGPDPTIVSLSLGGTRRFMIKPKRDHPDLDRFALDLHDGDLLVMGGRMQAKYLHQVPQATAAVEPRLNLTLRRYLV